MYTPFGPCDWLPPDRFTLAARLGRVLQAEAKAAAAAAARVAHPLANGAAPAGDLVLTTVMLQAEAHLVKLLCHWATVPVRARYRAVTVQ